MIELFFDFISPYAHVGCQSARALGQRVGHEIEPRPVLFAAFLNAFGTRGPAEVPSRRAYVIKDSIRTAARVGVPIEAPPAHPFNPLVALRVAALEMPRDERWRIIDALCAGAWGGGGGIEGPERVAAVLGAAGIDAAPLIARAATEGKELLRRNTDEALARGAFGVPTFFVDGEMFFGVSSYPEIEAYVRGEDPVAERKELIEKWATLPASATRPAATKG